MPLTPKLSDALSEVAESAIDHDAVVGFWLPHSQGRDVTCKLWRILPSNFKFFLDGRIMMGPGTPLWIYLVFLLVGVSASFVFFDVLPFYGGWHLCSVGSVVLFLTFTALYNLLRLAFTEPGYMLPHSFSDHHLWLTKETTLAEIYEKYGYTSFCKVCKIFQKRDTFHCTACHACIDGGDHHCMIFGICVGKRNFRYFYVFLIATNLALCLGLIMSITHFVQNWIAFGAGAAFARAVTLYIIISTVFIPPLGLYVLVMLPIIHSKLIYRGVTLNQEDGWVALFEIDRLNRKEKIQRFFRNFYLRVIKTPPPSQIPCRVLQLTVKMPAIPRTQLVNMHHHSLQNETTMSRISLMTVYSRAPPTYYEFRLEPVHRYMDELKSLSRPIESLEKIQKELKAEEKSTPKKKPIQRSLLAMCLSRCSRVPIFPQFPAPTPSYAVRREAVEINVTSEQENDVNVDVKNTENAGIMMTEIGPQLV